MIQMCAFIPKVSITIFNLINSTHALLNERNDIPFFEREEIGSNVTLSQFLHRNSLTK